MFDQMIHDIHHWNRISQYFHMNYIENKISKMSNLGKVNFFSPFHGITGEMNMMSHELFDMMIARFCYSIVPYLRLKLIYF